MQVQDTEPAGIDSALVARRVRELMEQHGIAKRNQTSKLSQILGLSFVQAHRKMTGSAAWTLNQIKAVAMHFGQSPGALIESIDSPEAPTTRGTLYEAELAIRDKRLACLASITGVLGADKRCDFVALQQDGGWLIYESADAPEGERFAVERIELRSRQMHSTRPVIAVIDDEKDIADNVCEYLNERGFKAVPYYTAATIRDAVRSRTFDGFIIDWLLGRETAESAIEEIRASQHSNAPITLLTGKLQTGKADEDDIARIIRTFGDIVCLEKPARLSLLAADLAKRLEHE
jgi:CheY-like chemotaxis protein